MTIATEEKTASTRRVERNCLDCGRALRPMKAKRDEWPGTLIHQGRGLCSKHYHARRDGGTLKDIPKVYGPVVLKPTTETGIREGFDLQHAIYAEQAWQADRRKRIERNRRMARVRMVMA